MTVESNSMFMKPSCMKISSTAKATPAVATASRPLLWTSRFQPRAYGV